MLSLAGSKQLTSLHEKTMKLFAMHYILRNTKIKH